MPITPIDNPTTDKILPFKNPASTVRPTILTEFGGPPNPTIGKITPYIPPATFDAYKHKAETKDILNPTKNITLYTTADYIFSPLSKDTTFKLTPTTAGKSILINPTENTLLYTTNDYIFSPLNKDTAFTLTPKLLANIPTRYNPDASLSTNMTVNSQAKQALATAGVGAATLFGVTNAADSIVALYEQSNLVRSFSTLDFDQLNNIPGVSNADFRAKRILNTRVPVSLLRLDGTRSAFKGKGAKVGLPIASVSPIGAYPVYNLNALGQMGYGWGDHGSLYAIRNDYTLQSNVRSEWDGTQWKKIGFPDSIIPFRGDRVTVIDFKRNTKLENTYRWWPNDKEPWKSDWLQKLNPAYTRDFIKFYFAGPQLFPGSKETRGDIIVFRSIIKSLSDRFSPNWTSQQMVGRADPNYYYTGFSREMDLDFTVYATDRDELKPIWRKLNAIAGYTAPTYNTGSIGIEAPWMRITIGDLFREQPCFISSLSYTLHDSDTTWEINFEEDPDMMQAPHKVDVSMGLTMITNNLPQKDGRFYTLAKSFDEKGNANPGNDNWLSDFK